MANAIHPYLNFDGQCAEAFRFYEKVLGGKIVLLQTIGESPMKDQLPPAVHGRVMHVHMEVGGTAILGSDSQPGQHTPPKGFNVSVQVPAYADAERVFKALAEGGRETMPFQKTFWSSGFGMLVDRYGIPWMVNCAQQTSAVTPGPGARPPYEGCAGAGRGGVMDRRAGDRSLHP